jgi:CHAT domain-containing protein
MHEMINDINGLPYDEVHAKIESFESKLDLNSYLSLRTMLFMHYYLYNEALNLLEDNYQSLNFDLKKLLADLHFCSGETHERALEIFDELYNKYPNTRGLYESISRLVLNNELSDGQKWIDICLDRNPDNVIVLDNAANFYNKKGQYTEAKELRHKLFKISNDPKQLLLSEILSIQESVGIDKHEAEKRIVAFADKHKSNSSLCDECYYRLGLLWYMRYNSSFKAFQSLYKVSDSIENEFAGKASRLKLETLIDLVAKNKAKIIKPARYKNLSLFLAEILISSIPSLTAESDGFWAWRTFIEKAQDFSTWEKALGEIMLEILSTGKVQSIHDLFEKSYYMSDKQISNEKSSIFIARLFRSEHPPETSWNQAQKIIDETVDSPQGVIAYVQSPIEDCFVRYNLAILASDRGKHQIANNHALHLWMVANQAIEPSLSRLSRLLGIIAWGYARFRSGDTIEGIACLLSSLELSIKHEEVGPFIEDGYRTLKYWILNSHALSNDQKKSFVERIKNPVEPEYRSQVYSLLSQQKWEDLYFLLSKYISQNKYDSEWAGDFWHYIQAAFQTGRRKEAVDLILNNYNKLIKALEGRKNLRPLILSSMSQMVFLEKHLNLTKQLLDKAVYDMELQRSQFFHREERAAFLDNNRDIYSDHTVITVALSSEQSIQPVELLKVMNRVTVRSLVESRNIIEQPSPELFKIEKEYQNLLKHYIQTSAKGIRFQPMTNSDLEYLKEVQDTLLKNHPFYRSLPLIDFLSERQLQEKINEDEILYQVVIGKFFSAYMIVTTNEISFNILPIDREKIIRHVKIVSDYMSLNHKYHTNPTDKVNDSIEILSKGLFSALSDYLAKNRKRRIFICKDVSLGMFSSSLIKLNKKWLFECVDSIHNILSPVELMNRTALTDSKYKVNLFLFGPNTDSAISKIATWQKREDNKQSVFLDTLDMQNAEAEIERLQNLSPYIAFIAGHGVHDTNRQSGAIFIYGKKELILARDLNPIFKTCKVAIVLSCSSGTPVTIQPEKSEGIWAGILGSGVKRALLCTWDVDAKTTLGIIDYLLSNDHSKFSSILCDVKRGMVRNDQYSNPYFWGGFEYWGVS